MSTGIKLRNIREEKGILQHELANAVNINVSVLNRIEKGTRAIRDDELLKIAQALHISIDELLGNTNPAATKVACNREDEHFLSMLHALDARGRASVLATLRREYDYVDPKAVAVS